jgi:DNA-binding YbaB/EbfC family protein
MKFDLQNILQQAQQMQVEVERKRQELNSKIVEAESGGGMVKIKMTGNNRVTELKISKEIVNPEDIEMLEDLIIAAVNKASQEVDALTQEEMGALSNMMPNIPGLNL